MLSVIKRQEMSLLFNALLSHVYCQEEEFLRFSPLSVKMIPLLALDVTCLNCCGALFAPVIQAAKYLGLVLGRADVKEDRVGERLELP